MSNVRPRNFAVFSNSKLIIAAILSASALLYPYGREGLSNATGAPSSFAPASYPMARGEFFRRINSSLVATCGSSRKEYNLSGKDCLDLVAKRTESCASSASIPISLSDSAEFKRYGRAYLSCAKPFFFCHGVEVKTLESVFNDCG